MGDSYFLLLVEDEFSLVRGRDNSFCERWEVYLGLVVEKMIILFLLWIVIVRVLRIFRNDIEFVL